jgi:hypothetical protein
VVSHVARGTSRAAPYFIFVVSSFPWQFEFAFFYNKVAVYCLQCELRVAVRRASFGDTTLIRYYRLCGMGSDRQTDRQTDGWLTFGYLMCNNVTVGRDKKNTPDINEM